MQTVVNNGWIKTASTEHAVFDGVGAELTKYEGQKVSLYFALTPGSDDKALHFLTIENVNVVLSEPGQTPPLESETENPEPEQSELESTEAETKVPVVDRDEGDTEQGGNQPAPDEPLPDTRNNKWGAYIAIAIIVSAVIVAGVLVAKRRI